MTKLCFLNFYHNGDLFHSKPFVRQVIDQLGSENVLYAHNKDPRVIEDLGIQTIRLQGLSDKVKIAKTEDPDMLFVNTWIGSYFDKYEGECTLNFNMKMWADIYEDINSEFNTNLKLGPIEDYLPYVDFRKFDTTRVRSYLDLDKRIKILFCNGPALSGQCEYNSDLREFIGPIATVNDHKTFYVTHKLDNMPSNVVYTGDVIKSDRCDLNEVSYISLHCNLIIGRNSGPFCFASVRENLIDPTKTFYAFGHQETDCFTLNVPKKANFIFEKFETPGKLYNSIRKLVETT